MLSIRALFARYATAHRQMRIPARNLSGARVDRRGQLEAMVVQGNQLTVHGWSYLETLSISYAGQIYALRPTLSRADVRDEFGLPENVGFMTTIPYRKGNFTVHGDEVCIIVRGPNKLHRSLKAIKLVVSFGRDCLQALPDVLAWQRASSAQDRATYKQKIKVILGLDAARTQAAPMIHDAVIQCKNKYVTPDNTITIVLPVFNAFAVLQECLERVVLHTDCAWRLILIDDCSTDDRIAPYLEAFLDGENARRVTLICNETNLGFVGSVNLGLRAAQQYDGHVVLLNSDALVPDAWASRLISPLSDANIASTTPISNDAEVLSIPCIVVPSNLVAGGVDRIDLAARELFGKADVVDIPTGVGFCMAISAHWLGKIPQLDTVFGRGYGEEVDWCRKALALGARHVAVPCLFVEHKGGQSFGSDEKLARTSTNNQIIAKRYRDYDSEVQNFIRTDPLIATRMTLGLAWAAAQQSDPVTMFVAHSLGGGADDATNRAIGDQIAEGRSVVVVRLGGNVRFLVELHCVHGITRAAIESRKTLDHVLKGLPDRNVVYACGVGDSDPVTVPQMLINWAHHSQKSSLEIQFHDFFPISPSYNLLDDDGRYSGVPIAGDQTDNAHTISAPDGSRVGLDQWQAAWGSAVDAAQFLRVYSKSSAEIVCTVWPDCASRMTVAGHHALVDVAKVEIATQGPHITIGVLGNIGKQKGAKLLADLSAHLHRTNRGRIVVIGDVDPRYTLAGGSVVHGKYSRDEINALTDLYRIDRWLIPSIWPETFSFTTHEALATGLPVWCLDLGGQADAVRAAGEPSKTIPMSADIATIADLIVP